MCASHNYNFLKLSAEKKIFNALTHYSCQTTLETTFRDDFHFPGPVIGHVIPDNRRQLIYLWQEPGDQQRGRQCTVTILLLVGSPAALPSPWRAAALIANNHIRQSQGSPVVGRGVARSGIISGLLAHEDGPTFIVGSHWRTLKLINIFVRRRGRRKKLFRSGRRGERLLSNQGTPYLASRAKPRGW